MSDEAEAEVEGADFWFSLEGERLAQRLEALADEHDDPTNLHWALFDFYNHLMLRAQAGDGEVVLRQARTAVELFRARDLAQPEAMFLEAEARLSMGLGDLPAGLSAMERMAERAVPDQADEVAGLAKDVWDSSRGDYRLELSGPVLATVSRVYAKLGETEQQVGAMLEAANLYAHNGARGPAQATLHDALVTAHDSGSVELVARVLMDATVVGFDRRDAETGLAAADEALEIWRDLGKPAPFRLVANRATLLMQLDRSQEAAKVYEELLRAADDDQRFGLLSNLASIRRRQGRIDEARDYIGQAKAARGDHSVAEPDLELELIAANVAAEAGDAAALLQALTAACEFLDVGLASIFRLHHRRGFRERYLNRVEGLMAALPATGAAANLVPLLATVHGGVVADWVAVLAWASELEPGTPETKAVHDAVRSVRLVGAPFLPRRLEDRDDAWMPNLEGKAWDALGLAVDRALAAETTPPHRIVDLASVAAALNSRREGGWAILAPTFHGGELILWLLAGDAYRRVTLDLNEVFAFAGARDRFAKKGGRAEFQAALAEYVGQLAAILGPEFEQLPATCPGLIVLQDLFDSLPLMAVALSLDSFRTRMAEGLFELRTAPVLFPSSHSETFKDPAIVPVIDSADNLKLAKHEAAALAQAFGQTAPAAFEAVDEAGILAALASADILVVSTHGWSITNYVDPAFASLGVGDRPHAVSVGTIQQAFPDLPHRLVLLNACHAGAAVPPPIEKGMRTHDSAGYPALLLMNRRTVVSAPGWPLFDSVSLLHAGLVGEGLAGGLPAGRALCAATARLRDMTRGEIVERFEALPPSDDIAQAADRFRGGERTDQPFHHPYVCGGFAIYGLI